MNFLQSKATIFENFEICTVPHHQRRYKLTFDQWKTLISRPIVILI